MDSTSKFFTLAKLSLLGFRQYLLVLVLVSGKEKVLLDNFLIEAKFLNTFSSI
jgi:hypothetical protein